MDVQQFHEGLHRNIEKLNRLEEEIQGIKQAVEELVLLEDALKGEGGNAIRSFYQECHLPLLNFFISFKSRFADTLRRIGEALNSFEPDRMGYIRQEFLEGDVQAGLEEIRRITGTLTDETNSIMDSVADIVSLPHLDDSEVQEGVRFSERQNDSAIEGLMEFDQSQSAALSLVSMDLKKMEQWIIDVESMMTEGLTGADFPADSWKAITARHPLRLSLTAHDASVDGLTNMSGSNHPNMVFGKNSYQLAGIAGINASPVLGATVGESNTSNLSHTASAQVENSEVGNSVADFFKETGKDALDAGKWLLNEFLLNDVKTIFGQDVTIGDRLFAMGSFLPVGRVVKVAKFADGLVDAKKVGNVAEDGKGLSLPRGLEYKNYRAVEYIGKTKVNGEVKDISRRIFQRLDIDYKKVDPETGKTNYQLMKSGRPPIWKDGTRIELHHLIQREPGSMVELPQSMHKEYDRILHGLVENGGSFRNDPVLKKQYENFRTKYWRWRAKEIDKNEEGGHIE
nr:T7SS effector LXG polymorphic toxin [Bhargavaea massiliensis]